MSLSQCGAEALKSALALHRGPSSLSGCTLETDRYSLLAVHQQYRCHQSASRSRGTQYCSNHEHWPQTPSDQTAEGRYRYCNLQSLARDYEPQGKAKRTDCRQKEERSARLTSRLGSKGLHTRSVQRLCGTPDCHYDLRC